MRDPNIPVEIIGYIESAHVLTVKTCSSMDGENIARSATIYIPVYIATGLGNKKKLSLSPTLLHIIREGFPPSVESANWLVQ
jgi:hypothetical protein